MPVPVSHASIFVCGAAAYLRPIGVIRRLLAVYVYSFGVEIDSCRPVVGSKSFIPFILEGNRFLSGHGERDQGIVSLGFGWYAGGIAEI
jgi:hypothetical protein